MSITIRFSMGPKKNWFGGTLWNQDTAEELAKNLALDMGYHCDVSGGYLIFQFCPEGFLWMTWRGGKLVGECQTNIAGPGFHAAVIHFIEQFAKQGEMKLKVEDETGYYKHRDFQRMRSEFFYVWFAELMRHVADHREGDARQMVCWPSDYYIPESQPDMVISHIRSFPYKEIVGVVNSGLSMSFAKDFFIWNEEQKDACFYRNCGLVLLNQECYFMPSKRSERDKAVNHGVIYYLEKALEMDPQILFPKEEYLEVCALDGKEAEDVSQVKPLSGAAPVGFRKGIIYRKLGAMSFGVPGCYLYDADRKGNTEHYFDGKEYGDHDYYICALDVNGTAKFQDEAFGHKEVLEICEFSAGAASGKVAFYEPEILDGRKRFALSAQVIYKNQITMISMGYSRSEEKEWAFDLIKKVHPAEPEE